MTDQTVDKEQIIIATADIVAAYVSNNAISAQDLPNLMQTIHSQVSELVSTEPEEDRPDPAVPIKKSVTDKYIVCLEDGAKLKMLKRYLRTRYDMSPDDYRARWGLPADYPMVAPEYAARRSQLAKDIGLGKR